jgi:hypothetical protein
MLKNKVYKMQDSNKSYGAGNTNLVVLEPSTTTITIRSIVHSIIIWNLWNHIPNRNSGRVTWETKA